MDCRTTRAVSSRSINPYCEQCKPLAQVMTPSPWHSAGWWDGGAAPPAECVPGLLCRHPLPFLTRPHLIFLFRFHYEFSPPWAVFVALTFSLPCLPLGSQWCFRPWNCSGNSSRSTAALCNPSCCLPWLCVVQGRLQDALFLPSLMYSPHLPLFMFPHRHWWWHQRGDFAFSGCSRCLVLPWILTRR